MSILDRLKSNGQVGRNGHAYSVTLNELYRSEYIVGDMLPYDLNRKIDWDRVKRYSEDFNPDYFGMILAVPVKVNGVAKLERRGGHHRMLALKMTHDREGSLGTDGNCNVTVHVFPTRQALDIYLAEGSAVGLKINDLLANTDLAFASLIRSSVGLIDTSPCKGVSLYTKKQLKQIASILYCLSLSTYNDLSVEKVLSSGVGIKVKEFSKIPNNSDLFTVRLSHTKRANFVEAMNYALDVLRHVIKLGDINQGTKNAAVLDDRSSKFLCNGYLFTYLVWNKLINGAVTAIKAETLARSLMVKEGQLIKDAINALGSKDFDSFEEKIYAIARTKQGYVRGEASI